MQPFKTDTHFLLKKFSDKVNMSFDDLLALFNTEASTHPTVKNILITKNQMLVAKRVCDNYFNFIQRCNSADNTKRNPARLGVLLKMYFYYPQK